jgi:paraquat-inducible protein A
MMSQPRQPIAKARELRDEAASAPSAHWVECPDCGLLQPLPSPIARHNRHCHRCGSSFGRGLMRSDAALALAITALVLFLLANFSPLMAIDVGGRGQSVRLGSGVAGLADHDLAPLAIFVLAISILAPLGRVVALGYVLFHLRGAGRPHHLAPVLRFAERMRPWAMLDVFLIGALIALTKLHDLAAINIGVGLWALGLLVVALAAFDMTADRRVLWDHVSPPHMLSKQPSPGSWLGCRECGLVQPLASHCTRCRARLHQRKPQSVHRCAALVVTGLVLYLPANLYPVLTVISFGRGTTATIIGGVSELMTGSDWPLAVIVFGASVAVPLLKLIGLGSLLLSTRLRWRRRLADRTRLYRLIELVSRWSSVDIFVTALLTALVTLGNLATVEPGLGVLAFGAVVFVTMLATESFDPRLIWDAAGANHV